jgi:prepilin-type N-terminal cleavage/methylation domain-containing protein
MKRSKGMTVLELMIVLAIIGGGMFLLRSGFRVMTKADLVENSTELSAILKRTSQLSVETGILHRVTFDLDKNMYAVEQCEGTSTIQMNEALRPDEEDTKRAIEKGKEKLREVPMDQISSDPEAAT